MTPDANGPLPYLRLLFDRFRFRGFHGRAAWCRLEVLPRTDGRVVVIATEVPDNPGTSVTNAAEHLASFACDRLGIHTDRLVWVEHYGDLPGKASPTDRGYDLVTFARLPPEPVVWSPSVLAAHPDGWPGYFDDPQWRSMTDYDWRGLGLIAPPPVPFS